MIANRPQLVAFPPLRRLILDSYFFSVGKLPKIPKKQQTNIQPQVSEDLFKSTMYV
jgi:hypothetical protein